MDKTLVPNVSDSIQDLVILKSSTYHFVAVDGQKVFARAIKSAMPNAVLVGNSTSSNDVNLINTLKELGVREVIIKK